MQDQRLSNFVKILRVSLHTSTDMLGGRDEPYYLQRPSRPKQ